MNPDRSSLDRDDDSWSHPAALQAAWLEILRKHRRKEFDAGEFEAFSMDPDTRCAMLSQAVRSGQWRPAPLREIALRKPGGGVRLLRVPALEDRVVQGALARWLSEQVEPRLGEASHAYRVNRGVHSALKAVGAALGQGLLWAFKADIREFFDNVDTARLGRVLADWGLWRDRVAFVVRSSWRSEVSSPEAPYCLCRGLPQGSPLSPVLSNLHLDAFDAALAESGAVLVRYADDFVLLAPSRPLLALAVERAESALAALGLGLRGEKTQWLEPGQTLRFLGAELPLVQPSASGESTAPEIQAAAPEEAEATSQESPSHPDATATPLLRTLYLLTHGNRLLRDGDGLVVETPNASPRHIPAARVNLILAFGATTITSGAVALCIEMGIPIMLAGDRARHFGLVDPLGLPQLPLLAAQLRVAQDDAARMEVARTLVRAKLGNSALMLRRWSRGRETPEAHETILRLREAARRVAHLDHGDRIRGAEGAAAAAYFRQMGALLGPAWGFDRRARRPPPDPVNSMLSYGYTVLYYNMLALVLARGLHPHLGFIHAPRAGHHALVSDLVEPFRAVAVDAVVMNLALNGGVKPGGFERPDRNGPCLMDQETRRRLIDALETKFNTRLEVRGMPVKLDLRRLMDMQVLSLVDRLSGRTSGFRPYLAR